MTQIAGVDLGEYHSVTDVFLEACDKYAQKPAFSCMGQTLSFTEMERLTANFASYLQN
ncbi:MAG: long-chain acyl-CoA synthetase, partial [Oceanospirillaceae bacterium]